MHRKSEDEVKGGGELGGVRKGVSDCLRPPIMAAALTQTRPINEETLQPIPYPLV